MAGVSRWRRLLEPVLSIGSYAGEPETKRGGRRVIIVAVLVAAVLTIPTAFSISAPDTRGSRSSTCSPSR